MGLGSACGEGKSDVIGGIEPRYTAAHTLAGHACLAALQAHA
jgi:hypothetical protein